MAEPFQFKVKVRDAQTGQSRDATPDEIAQMKCPTPEKDRFREVLGRLRDEMTEDRTAGQSMNLTQLAGRMLRNSNGSTVPVGPLPIGLPAGYDGSSSIMDKFASRLLRDNPIGLRIRAELLARSPARMATSYAAFAQRNQSDSPIHEDPSERRHREVMAGLDRIAELLTKLNPTTTS